MRGLLFTLLTLTFLTSGGAIAGENAIKRCRNLWAIGTSARMLIHPVEHFHQHVKDHNGYSHIAGDIHEFLEKIRNFRRLTDENIRCRYLRREFREIRHAFKHVSKVFRRAHDEYHDNRDNQLMRRFRRIQEDFSRLRKSLRRNRRGSPWNYWPRW